MVIAMMQSLKAKNLKINIPKINVPKSLVESFLSLSVLSGLNALLPLVTLPYILRVVGSANYGIYAYVYVLIQYLLLLSTYGFNLSVTKQISRQREDKNQVCRIYNSATVCRLLLFLAGIFIVAILSPLLFNSDTKKIMFLMGLGIVLGDTFNPTWLFQGMEKMRYMTIVNLVSKTVFTILIFVIVREKNDFVYIILLNSLGFLIAGFVSTIIARKQFGVRFYLPKLEDIKLQFREGFALFGSSIGASLYSNANVFILSFFVSDAAVGMYAAAEKIIRGLQSLTSPITQALYPFIGKDFHGQTIDYQMNKIKKVVQRIAATFLIPNILVFLCAGLLVKLFCGDGYSDSILLVKIMCPVITIGTLNYTLGVIGLVNLDKGSLFFYGTVIAGILSIVFLVLTVSHLGTMSASISLILSELILLVICAYHLKRIKRNEQRN